MQLRTQIYLEPSQHAALIKEARKLGLSLAGMIRKLVDEHLLAKGPAASDVAARERAAMGLVGLGKSGISDVSENTESYYAQAVYDDMVRDRRVSYKAKKRRAR